MGADEENRRAAFGLLYQLGNLDEADIEGYYSSANVRLLQTLLEDLEGKVVSEEDISPKSFAHTMKGIQHINKLWSRRLGDVIIAAGDAFDRGERRSAVGILEEFIGECPTRFHREHAVNQKRSYENALCGS